MRKSFIGLSLSFLACGAAAVVIATSAAAQAPAPRAPAAQAQPLPPTRPLPRTGRGRGPAQTAERREQRCQNIAALAAGRLAYLEERLDLTDAQTAAFGRWRDTRMAAAHRRAETCAAQPAGRGGRGANRQAAANPAERLARQEARLQRRLSDIQAERPALEALTASLSPEQRQTLARTAMGRGMGGRGAMMRGQRGRGMMMQRGGQRGMMRRGPMGRGPDGPMGRGGDTPPPAQ